MSFLNNLRKHCFKFRLKLDFRLDVFAPFTNDKYIQITQHIYCMSSCRHVALHVWHTENVCTSGTRHTAPGKL